MCAFETFLKVCVTMRELQLRVCVCFQVYLFVCKHVSVCVCVGGGWARGKGGGVTGGRYAMSWLTRVLLCCSVLHD